MRTWSAGGQRRLSGCRRVDRGSAGARVDTSPYAVPPGLRAFTCVSLTGPDATPWCLRWRTAIMPGIAFWYFATEREAQEARRELLTGMRSAGRKDVRQ